MGKHEDLVKFFHIHFTKIIENKTTSEHVNSQQIIKQLEKDKPDVDWLNSINMLTTGNTLLWELITTDDNNGLELAEWLLQNRANPNLGHQSKDGWEVISPLYQAAKVGNLEFVKLLQKYGAIDDFSKIRYFSEKPLCVAFYNMHFQIVAELCERDYSKLFDISWYEYMDGFEYSCIELVMQRGEHFAKYENFFVEEHLAGHLTGTDLIKMWTDDTL